MIFLPVSTRSCSSVRRIVIDDPDRVLRIGTEATPTDHSLTLNEQHVACQVKLALFSVCPYRRPLTSLAE